MHALPVQLRVGTRDVDELEQAELRSGLRVADRAHAVGVDRDELAGLDVADEVRADDIERGRLRREDPAAVGAAEHERTEAVRVAHTEQVRLVHEHERERALELRQDRLERVLEVAAVGALLALVGAAEQLADELAVGGEHARQHPQALGELDRVREVAVVAERDTGVADRPVDGLRVAPRARPRRRVAHVPHREVPVERRELELVEDLADQAHVLDDRDHLAVARGDPGRLLAAVLERVEPEVGELRDRPARRIDAEDAARLAYLVVHPAIIPCPPRYMGA